MSNIINFMDRVLTDQFAGDSWTTWRSILKATFGLDLSSEDLDTYQRLTERTKPPTEAARELWAIVGRRGGKSQIAALVATFLATTREYTLAPGEVGTFMCIASDRRQARTIRRYVTGLMHSSPVLENLIARETAEAIELSNRVAIEVHTASFRAVRGYTVIGATLDELAFFRQDDSANPDVEILASLRPAMATVPGAMLLCLSSPYARRGEVWRAFREHFGRDDDPVLVVKADTRSLNPTVPQDVIARAYRNDAPRASAEYGAEFRADIESFVPREIVETAVEPNVFERGNVPGVAYRAFVDPSGGSKDSMTLAVSHVEGDTVVLDRLVEVRPPFSPEEVVTDFVATLRTYHVSTVVGDRYAGEWPRERFRAQGVRYEPSARPKSDLYRDLLPLLNSKRVSLLDNVRLVTQLVSLERRTARGGRDSIDHAPGGHDDAANAVAGAIVLAAERGSRQVLQLGATW